MFFEGSRYEDVAQLELTDWQGRVIRYKGIRFTPAAPALASHTVSQGERLDHLAQQYFRDPERFWRIADANAGMWADDLVAEPGHRLLIPAAEE
jgi:hypothetical protein